MRSNCQHAQEPVNRQILDWEAWRIEGKLKKSITCMLNNPNTEYYIHKVRFQRLQADFMTYMNEVQGVILLYQIGFFHK